MTAQIRRLSALALSSICVSLLGACATVTGDPTQVVHVETLDARGQPIEGMRCHLSNASSDYFGDSPMFGLEVHRSASDLKISCRSGDLVAEGTAVSRSGIRGGITGAVNLMMPGGSGLMVIDHFTGYRYAYPSWVQLRIGQKLVFDASDDVEGQPTVAIQKDPEKPVPSKAPVIERGLARGGEDRVVPSELPAAGRVLVRSD
ncbi:MAG TPA: hypothetical protein VH278_09665 [Burkholderiaceae bacterium]|nr:hypothetical protein [Burkholderiaceae bacterium]